MAQDVHDVAVRVLDDVLVRDGEPIEAALRLEHMPLDEVLEAARNKGIGTLGDIKLPILEVSGKISIITASDSSA